MSWTQSEITRPIPEELSNISSSLSGVISTVSPILDAASDLLDTIKNFYIGNVDPYQTLVDALIPELENLINDLFGTGVFNLIVDPFNIEGPRQRGFEGWPLLTAGEAILTAVSSFDDAGDTNRPQFSNDAEVTMFGIMAVSPSLTEFIQLMELILEVFEIPDFRRILNLAKRYNTTDTTPSRQPDWKSIRFNSIDYLSDTQKVLVDGLNILKGYKTVPDDVVNDLIGLFQRRISILQDLLGSLDNLINKISNTSGIYVVNVPPSVGGNTLLKQSLRDDHIENCLLDGYTAMALFVGGGPSLNTVDNIRKLLV